MTRENKLLLKDLCARIPYGVKVSILGGGAMPLKNLINSSIGWYVDVEGAPTDFSIDEIKPYLRPMSSMTDEERSSLRVYCRTQEGIIYDIGVAGAINSPAIIDFLNTHHFDYRGLIEKGLALEAPKDMYKID